MSSAMLSQFSIEGFKRFQSCTLDLEPLTVLTGLNGAGKTSVIQALLLLRQASLASRTFLVSREADQNHTATVPLNGAFGLELGSAEEVLNIQHGSQQIALGAELRDGTVIHFDLKASKDQPYLEIIAGQPPGFIPGALGGSARAFTYLCAERLGPREILRDSAEPEDALGVGVQGEYCAQIIDVHGLNEKQKVPLSRRLPGRTEEVDAYLKYQVEAWLSDIVRPIELDVTRPSGILVRTLRFRPPGGTLVRAPNMGFGVSYCLPIVLGGLFAPEGSLLIVENPEAHLHPAGQSRMGVFLATLAATGVQVILETHSDHVLNGIRRAIGEYRLLPSEHALVHFFDMNEASEPMVSTLKFTGGGNLNDWPKHFFDQYQVDVAALARVRRGPPR